MPKAIFVPQPLNTADIPHEGARVKIITHRKLVDQWTTIGTTKVGLGLDVEYKGKKFSQMFSLDKAELTGSIGRILVTLGADNTEAPDFEEKLNALDGSEWTVMKRGDKIYWYP